MYRGVTQEAEMTVTINSELARLQVEDRIRNADACRPVPKRRHVRAAAIIGAAFAAAALAVPSVSSADSATVRFDQPGEHTFLAPQGATSLRVRAYGAKGGNGYHNLPGGLGDFVWGTLDLTTNRSFAVQVGVGGGSAESAEHAGAGGGYSGISRCPLAARTCAAYGPGTNSRLIVAAGGGGGGGQFGGGAGGAAGAAGSAAENGTAGFLLHLGNALGGQPGTLTSGGAGGIGAPDGGGNGLPGMFGHGGNGDAGGGGGGDGYYGGGAGGRGYSRNYEGAGGGG